MSTEIFKYIVRTAIEKLLLMLLSIDIKDTFFTNYHKISKNVCIHIN